MLMSNGSIKILAAATLGLCVVARTCPTCGPFAEGPGAGVIAADGLTKQSLAALPDNAVLEHKGARFTKADFVSRAMKGHADAAARRQALAAQDRAKFQAYRAKFYSDQRARLQQKNAAFGAEVGRRRQALAVQMTPQRQALHREAFDLIGRAQHASPAEKAQLNTRAGQILQQLGGPAPAMPVAPGAPMNLR